MMDFLKAVALYLAVCITIASGCYLAVHYGGWWGYLGAVISLIPALVIAFVALMEKR